MKTRGSLWFQLRLILSSLGGVICAVFFTPFVMPLLEIGNVVLAGGLGALLFLLIATISGFVWRRSIMAAPIRWGVAAPAVIAAVIYASLRLAGGSDPTEAELAAAASLVAGFCAVFASAIFLAWTIIAPLEPQQPE